jgi:hypothetical protein
VINNPAHVALLTKAIKDLSVNVMNPPRDGKRLLVMDLDYCIFDMK